MSFAAGNLLDQVIEEAKRSSASSDVMAEIAAADAAVDRLQRRHSALIQLRADGEISPEEFAEHSAETKDSIRAGEIRSQEARARLAFVDGSYLRKAAAAVRALVGSPHRLDDRQKRRLIESVADRIEIHVSPCRQLHGDRGAFVEGGSRWRIERVRLFARSPGSRT